MLLVALIISAFSLVQSLFGVGLLVFGTPTLLLLGYPFETALTYLLPASATISLLQLRKHLPAADLRADLAIFCIPGVVVGLILLAFVSHSVNIKAWVGCLLLLTGVLRCISLDPLKAGIRRYARPGLVVVGIIHGFTNMGGGLLSVLVSSLRSDKTAIRSNIAFGYLFMAVSQLIVLVVFWKKSIPSESIAFMAIAGLTYELVGQRMFTITSDTIYRRLLTAAITCFGILMMAL